MLLQFFTLSNQSSHYIHKCIGSVSFAQYLLGRAVKVPKLFVQTHKPYKHRQTRNILTHTHIDIQNWSVIRCLQAVTITCLLIYTCHVYRQGEYRWKWNSDNWKPNCVMVVSIRSGIRYDMAHCRNQRHGVSHRTLKGDISFNKDLLVLKQTLTWRTKWESPNAGATQKMELTMWKSESPLLS